MCATSKAALSPGRKLLVERMSKLNHGRILGLPVDDGEPKCDSATILHTLKFPGQNGPHMGRDNENFNLKKEVTELFEVFDRERSFTIQELVVVGGLPVRATLALKEPTVH